MHRYVVLAAMAALLGGCPVPQAPGPGEVHFLQEPQTGEKYYLYVPTKYSDKRDWPLVVTLHGTFLWDGPRRQVAAWEALAEKHEFLVAAPCLKSVQGMLPVLEDPWFRDLQADERVVLAVIDELQKKYRVDPQAVLLTGFSAGGYPLYYIGLRNPQRFSMLIARDCNSSIQIFEKIELAEEARDLPIAIFCGKDELVPVLQNQSWEAFRWLRLHRCYRTERHEIRGGHLRRPEFACELWRKHLPPRYRP